MFTFSLILLGIAVIAAVIAAVGRSAPAVGVAFVAGLLGAALIVGASISQVPTKYIGIVTEYGKPTGRTTGAGLKWHAPWQSIDDWDATRQTYNHLDDKCAKPGDGSLWVTVALQTQACIRVQVEWESVKTKRASDNWATYRESGGLDRFGVFYSRRVKPQIDDAVIKTMSTFNPFASVDANGNPRPVDLEPFRAPLRAAIEARLSDDITVQSIAFGSPQYDEETQKQIAAYSTKLRDKQLLAIDEQNAKTRRGIATEGGLTPFESACLSQAGAYAGLCRDGKGSQVILPAK